MKPIRIFYSELSGRFYATRAYRVTVKNQVEHFIITGIKEDVTNDIARAVLKHGVTFKREPRG